MIFEETLARIDADWRLSLQCEAQIEALRQQMTAAILRLNALNRDLTADESRGADSRQLREWRECRQWMRDVVTCFTRCLKEHQSTMGATAATRQWLEAAYGQFVVHGRQFDAAEQISQEFERYRLTLQQLLMTMSVARDPELPKTEQRVYHVLRRIATSVRLARTRR